MTTTATTSTTASYEIGLTERALSIALLLKYVLLGAYGAWAAIVEIPTFVIVGSRLFATAWAVIVLVTATLAAVGVVRSWLSGRRMFENISSALFVLTFIGYFFALLWRAISSENWGGAPLALIPLAVVVLPVIRFYTVIMRGRIRPKRVAR